jgi:hypothetical protein
MPSFKKVETTDPKKAVDILFGDAMGAVPVLSDKQFHAAHKRMQQSWKDASLVEGTENEVKSHILKQSEELAKMPGFKRFSIEVCLAEQGYKGEEAAKLWTWVEEVGIAGHLWKTKDKYHAFGVAIFRLAG